MWNSEVTLVGRKSIDHVCIARMRACALLRDVALYARMCARCARSSFVLPCSAVALLCLRLRLRLRARALRARVRKRKRAQARLRARLRARNRRLSDQVDFRVLPILREARSKSCSLWGPSP